MVTKEFVDGIEFEVVKQKYYNANKVNATLDEVKSAMYELIEENTRLKTEHEKLAATQAEIGETIMRSEKMANDTVAAANDLADQIVCQARLEADDMINGAKKMVEAAKADEAKAREDAAKIRAKAEAIDIQVARIITNAKEQKNGLSDKQMDAIDNILAQIDELSMAQETRLLKIRQLLMGMVTDI